MQNIASFQLCLNQSLWMAALKKVVILPCAEGFQVTDVVDGFNQIGFALTVFSEDPVCFWRKFRLKVGIIPKVP